MAETSALVSRSVGTATWPCLWPSSPLPSSDLLLSIDANGKSRAFFRSVREMSATRQPAAFTIGSLPFLERRSASFASARVQPALAVTKLSLVMTWPAAAAPAQHAHCTLARSLSRCGHGRGRIAVRPCGRAYVAQLDALNIRQKIRVAAGDNAQELRVHLAVLWKPDPVRRPPAAATRAIGACAAVRQR